jgi:hypothetical protein
MATQDERADDLAVVVTYRALGGAVEVVGQYTPAEEQSWDNPGTPAEFELTSVYVGTAEVGDALSDCTKQDLTKLALKEAAHMLVPCFE